MEWVLFGQLVLLALLLYFVIYSLISHYFTQVAICEVIVSTQLNEAERERQALYRSKTIS